MKIDNFKKFYECSKKATLRHFNEFRKEPVIEDGEVLSEKAQGIKALILNKRFDCQTQNVLDLMSLVLEEDLGKKQEKNLELGTGFSMPLPGAVFVLSENPNDNNYGVGNCVIKSINNIAIKRDGNEGNSLPNPYRPVYHPPTEAEFEEFMADFKIASENLDIEGDFPVKTIFEQNS